MAIRCFWLEPTGEVRYRLFFEEPGECPTSWDGKHHSADVPCSEEQYGARPFGSTVHRPTHCGKCGYAFTEAGHFAGGGSKRVYHRADTGEEVDLVNAPPGAMWDASWLVGHYAPTEDGRVIMVKCPGGGDWCIDGRASNCTMPEDRVHHCWVRHGEPPNLTVDKSGHTCAAGGGSIISGNYHGFLRNGEFTPPL